MLTRSRDSFLWKSDISKKMYSILGKGVEGVATNGCVIYTYTHTHKERERESVKT